VSDPLDFSGKVALVTGGARGVGRGIAERFLTAGAEVAICGRNEPETLPESGGRRAIFEPCDVRDAEQVDRMVGAVRERLGRLDVLVNNAGGSPAKDAAEASPRFHEAIIRLNLIAALHCAQRANAVMQSQPEGGAIVNIASVSGVRPSPGTAAYGAAKAGVLAHLHYGDEAGIAAVAATVPLGRMGKPVDVGNVCLFLASPLSSYVSGANVLMHGGGEPPPFLGAAKNVRPDGR
jgi:NAD(P)-dependent dehydrogenase (short-subunit alcohol dehydrogenase family)